MFDPPPKTQKLSRLRPLMGSLVAIEAGAASEDSALAAVEAAFAAVQRVGVLMHPNQRGSDLARLAAAGVGVPVEVDAWTFEVLELSAALNRQSEGSFDPCLPTAPGRMRDLELRAPFVTCHAAVHLDLGGIAKGYAVDRAVAELRRHGCGSGLVNAGGDLRVFGPDTQRLHVRVTPASGIDIELREGALAVSAARSAASPPEHRGFYSGATGAWVDGRPVAVLAPHAAIADALCKCALLCDPPLLAKLLDTYEARLLLPPAP